MTMLELETTANKTPGKKKKKKQEDTPVTSARLAFFLMFTMQCLVDLKMLCFKFL